ncbi:MAG: KEOPS complex subunit Pcc1 [Thermoplasmata archaeon]
MRKAEIILRGENAELLGQVLSPESGREIPRTKVSIESKGEETILRIETENTSALRAALNSYIRWGALASAIGDEVKSNEQ